VNAKRDRHDHIKSATRNREQLRVFPVKPESFCFLCDSIENSFYNSRIIDNEPPRIYMKRNTSKETVSMKLCHLMCWECVEIEEVLH